AFKKEPGNDTPVGSSSDPQSIQASLGTDLNSLPGFFDQRRLIDDLRGQADHLSFSRPALLAGYRACWLEPVIDSSGQTLGVIVLLSNGEQPLQEPERKYAQMAGHIGAIAWERCSALDSLAQSERRYREVFD
ncbi:GAF domain-containing protein, partial [Pseudomonas gingeri]|nr:GAF domain-containing protein [Pseudomonas gingeri]